MNNEIAAFTGAAAASVEYPSRMDSGDTSDDIEVYLKQYEVLQAFDKKFEGFLG